MQQIDFEFAKAVVSFVIELLSVYFCKPIRCTESLCSIHFIVKVIL